MFVQISSVNTTSWPSDEERVATLSFVLIDKNKNKVWERKEWKIFRELVTSARFVRGFFHYILSHRCVRCRGLWRGRSA